MELIGARVLTFGTAGAQGSGLVRAVGDRGAVAVRATSRPDRARAWAADGQEAVVADLTDTSSVLAAADGVDAVALHLPFGLGSPDATTAVIAAVQALRKTGVPVTVNLGAPVPPPGVRDSFGIRPTADAVLATGATALAPTAYLENHLAPWAVGPIGSGELVYPRPAGDLIAWIAARDLAVAAVAALATEVTAELLSLAGPTAITFDELAAELGAGIGRPVVFRRVTATEYGELLRPVLGDQAAASIAGAYGAMPDTQNPLMTLDAGATWTRLGITPTPVREWAESTLAPALSSQGS